MSPGFDRCDAAMPLFMEAIRAAGELTDSVFAEARFQVEQLPRLTVRAQKKFGWKPPKSLKRVKRSA
jgi:hypothetical protein